MILDTSFLIDLMRGNAAAKERMNKLVEKGVPTFVTAISVFELFTGLAQSSRPKEENDKIRSVLQGQTAWPFDDKSAETSGAIVGELANDGQIIDPEDTMIAGIALKHNEPVLTRNVKDFSRVQGLKVETY